MSIQLYNDISKLIKQEKDKNNIMLDVNNGTYMIYYKDMKYNRRNNSIQNIMSTLIKDHDITNVENYEREYLCPDGETEMLIVCVSFQSSSEQLTQIISTINSNNRKIQNSIDKDDKSLNVPDKGQKVSDKKDVQKRGGLQKMTENQSGYQNYIVNLHYNDTNEEYNGAGFTIKKIIERKSSNNNSVVFYRIEYDNSIPEFQNVLPKFIDSFLIDDTKGCIYIHKTHHQKKVNSMKSKKKEFYIYICFSELDVKTVTKNNFFMSDPDQREISCKQVHPFPPVKLESFYFIYNLPLEEQKQLLKIPSDFTDLEYVNIGDSINKNKNIILDYFLNNYYFIYLRKDENGDITNELKNEVNQLIQENPNTIFLTTENKDNLYRLDESISSISTYGFKKILGMK